jgi:hypothetical protein
MQMREQEIEFGIPEDVDFLPQPLPQGVLSIPAPSPFARLARLMVIWGHAMSV